MTVRFLKHQQQSPRKKPCQIFNHSRMVIGIRPLKIGFFQWFMMHIFHKQYLKNLAKLLTLPSIIMVSVANGSPSNSSYLAIWSNFSTETMDYGRKRNPWKDSPKKRHKSLYMTQVYQLEPLLTSYRDPKRKTKPVFLSSLSGANC